MNDSVSAGEATLSARPRAFDTILYGGLVVGILDGLFALIFYALILGAKPLRIFQTVAAGVLGRETSYAGGVKTFSLGILLHFVVASFIAAVYYAASRIIPILLRHAVISGLSYGMMAYLVMNYVVVPLSAIRRFPGPKRLPIFLTEIIGHALLVGLPIALLARRSARSYELRQQNTSTSKSQLKRKTFEW